MKSLLTQYCYLQTLDVLTSVAFLQNGLDEANPIVRAIIQSSSSPWHALLLVKLLALALGLYCWHIRKGRLLQGVNVCYAFLVAWNIVALIIGSSRMALDGVGGRVS
jgi:hypothetical protein